MSTTKGEEFGRRTHITVSASTGRELKGLSAPPRFGPDRRLHRTFPLAAVVAV
ncbi:hypothetical protein ACFXG6_03370 [Streptomyces roseus]|uniref:hypothetical protein n=1 Tax=Streptomyces roseus TaxID=66430 RepID=UPI003695AA1E